MPVTIKKVSRQKPTLERCVSETWPFPPDPLAEHIRNPVTGQCIRCGLPLLPSYTKKMVVPPTMKQPKDKPRGS